MKMRFRELLSSLRAYYKCDMNNIELYIKQAKMLNNFLETGALSEQDWEKSFGGLTEKMGYLIKDTTREEREAIVAESLGNIEGSCDGCAAGLAEMYQDYIDGKKELKDINMEFRRGYISGEEAPTRSRCEYF